MNRYKSLPEAICNLTQNHLHMSVWNYDLMKEVLEGVGFKNVQKTSYKKGMMDELLVKLLKKVSAKTAFLSISDTDQHSVAIVIME